MPRNSSRSPENDPAALLGMELARVRAAAGYPVQAAFAAELGYERTVISKAESGDRPPTNAVFTAWMDACGITGTERAMLERQLILARNARGAIPGWFTWWIDVERQADRSASGARWSSPACCKSRSTSARCICCLAWTRTRPRRR